MPVLLNLLSRSLPVLALASVLVILAGLLRYSDDLSSYWQPALIKDLAVWIAGTALLAGLLRWTLPRHASVLMIGLVTLHLTLVIGILPSLTTLLFFGSCTVLGLLLLEWLLPSDPAIPLIAGWSVGLALMLALFGVLIHYPVNYRLPYLALQFAPLGVLLLTGKASGYGKRLLGDWQQLNNFLQQANFWYCAVMVVLLGYLARHAFYPTITYDDNALHLRLWTELTFQHVAAFDVESLVWVVAPFAVDLMHAVISLGAAADARAAINLVLLVLLLQQVWKMLGHFVTSTSYRVLLLLLFASTPLLGNLLITLQTELMLALLATIAINLVLEMPVRWLSAHTLALLAIAGLCCAIKLPGAVLGLLLLASALAKLLTHAGSDQRRDLNTGTLLLVSLYVAMLAVLAFNSYVTAWRLTGNPVFPLYNAVFQSPLYELANFEDSRWIRGFGIPSYWNMFFNTSAHYESQNFVAGFQYLLLLPLALLALWRLPARRQYLLIMLPLLGFGLVMFASTQYWRYLFPVVPLASVMLAALVARVPSSTDPLWVRAAPVFALASCLLLNVRFYPGISWVFAISPQEAMSVGRRELLDEQYAPTRAATARINALLPRSTVLYPDEAAFGATLKGEPYYMMPWYAPAHGARVSTIQNEDDIARFLTDEGIDLVMWDTATPFRPESAKWQLGHLLSRRGYPEFQVGSVVVYRVAANDVAYTSMFAITTSQQATAQPLQLTTGDGIAVQGARNMRYSATYDCDSNAGFFVAQVNWDEGAPYYRLVPCADTPVNFAEALPIPIGAKRADIFITVRDTQRATVSALSLEIN